MTDTHPLPVKTIRIGRQPDNDGGFSWERLDLIEPIRAELS